MFFGTILSVYIDHDLIRKRSVSVYLKSLTCVFMCEGNVQLYISGSKESFLGQTRVIHFQEEV